MALNFQEFRTEVDELNAQFRPDERTNDDYLNRRQHITEAVLTHLAVSRTHYTTWIKELLRLYR